MTWLGKFLTSSIGQKLIMSLTGLFLILFLIVHLAGNLQLLKDDGGQAFNLYAKFMTTNPVIKVISYGLYLFILIHTFQGWMLWAKNRGSRNKGYAAYKVRAVKTNGLFAKNMGWLGTVIFIFIIIHLWQFWYKMKFGELGNVDYDGVFANDLYSPVKVAFSSPFFVIFYVVSMVVIAFHLWHGFQSAFQTLGWNHGRSSKIIRFLGKVYAVVVPAGFAIIPIVFYLRYAS
jgi:succinate dehydrogenase / fumarate reductase cytochrome b subunit